MKIKLLLLFFALFSGLYSYSQKISRTTFRVSNISRNIQSIEMLIDENIVLTLTSNGESVSCNTITGGDIDYWPALDKKGKVKSIGKINIDYWGNITGKEGKIKSIGNTNVDYWPGFDKKGKVKSIGNINIDYWGNIPGKEGKIKSIGNTNVDYWPGFDKKGKVKSIGNINIDYWGNIPGKEGKIRSITGNTATFYALSE